MAVFETFTLLFKADSAQLKKEVDDVKKKTGESTGEFKKAEEQAKKTDNEFLNLAKSLAGVAAAYFSVGAVVASFQASVAKTSGVAEFARDTGLAVEAISAWGTALENFGVDASVFRSSVDSIKSAFGGNVNEDIVVEYLPGLAEELKRLEASETGAGRRFAEQQLGLPQEFISFLLNTEKSVIDALNQQKTGAGIVTKRDAELVTDFNTATSKLSTAFDDLSAVMASDILPNLTKFANFLTGIVDAITFIKKDDTPNTSADYLRKNYYGSEPWRKPAEEKGKKEEDDRKYPNVPGVVDDPNTKTKIINLSPLPRNQIDYINRDIVEDGPGKQSFYIPPAMPTVSNSQAKSLYVGDININTTSQDAQSISNEVIRKLDQESQFMQSNSYFDNAVVV